MADTQLDFKPYGGWVILPNPAAQKRESGIILEDDVANKLRTNVLEVLAVGPDCRQTQVGDTVMVDPSSEAMIVHINEVSYLFVNEFQILGRFL